MGAIQEVWASRSMPVCDIMTRMCMGFCSHTASNMLSHGVQLIRVNTLGILGTFPHPQFEKCIQT